MKLFTAESSLYRSQFFYGTGSRVSNALEGAVRPSIFFRPPPVGDVGTPIIAGCAVFCAAVCFFPCVVHPFYSCQPCNDSCMHSCTGL